MRIDRVSLAVAGACLLAAVASPGGAQAATMDEVVARLNAVEKENATLRDRVKRLEAPKAAKLQSAPAAAPQSVAAPEQAYASAVYKAPMYPAAFNWTGCYVGGQGGAGIINDSYTGRNGFGGLIGGQAGCNYQIERFVIGVEGEWWWSGISNENKVPGFTTTTKNNWDADISLRLGLTLADRILSYAKAGAVWGGFNYSTSPAGATTEGSATLAGLLIGGGVEYAFTDHWTGRVEYTSDFMRGNVNVFGGTTQSATKQVVKVGVNYLFH